MTRSGSTRRRHSLAVLAALGMAAAAVVLFARGIWSPDTRYWVGASVVGLWIALSVTSLPRILVSRRIAHLEAEQISGEDQLKAENDVRTTLLQTTGTAVLILGVVFTFGQLQLGQRQLASSQRSAQRQLRLAQEGQITDRFIKAVSQLGHTSTDVRIGSIYGLRRIAEDSPSDRESVIAVLAAYIRGHALRPRTPDGRVIDLKPVKLPLMNRHPDVQIALTILLEQLPKAPSNVNLENLDLRGADISRANLDGVDISGSDLDGADLSWSHLIGNDFLSWRHVNLSHATLHRTKICSVPLWHVNLSHTELWHARFVNVDFAYVDFRNASFRDTHFHGLRADEYTQWSGGKRLVQGMPTVDPRDFPKLCE